MNIKFSSKVAIDNPENKKKHPILTVLVILFMVIMGAAILIKLLVGDLSGINIMAFVLPFLAYQRLRRNSIPEPQFAMAAGNIDFQEHEMKISYVDVDGGEKIGRFDEEIVVSYSDICCDICDVEYSSTLSCFHMVAHYKHSRVYKDVEKSSMSVNSEEFGDICVFVLDESVADEIKKCIQQYADVSVEVLDE